MDDKERDLWDSFARQALLGFLMSPSTLKPVWKDDYKKLADDSFIMANTMMDARKRWLKFNSEEEQNEKNKEKIHDAESKKQKSHIK